MHRNSRIKIVQAHLPLNNLYDLKEEEWGKGVDNLCLAYLHVQLHQMRPSMNQSVYKNTDLKIVLKGTIILVARN